MKERTKEVQQIETKIKQLFETKELFCQKNNYGYKDFGSKLRTVEKRFNWLNEFLEPLKLEVEIKPIDDAEPNYP